MENKIQNNYTELRKKSELTDKFILFADKIKIDEKDVPKTEKGLESKAKELIERINKKLDKLTDEEFTILKNKKIQQPIIKQEDKKKKKKKKY